MSSKISFLLSILDKESMNLVKVALSIEDINEHPQLCADYFDENDTKEYLLSLLPTHFQNFGPIVDVEEIFDAFVTK